MRLVVNNNENMLKANNLHLITKEFYQVYALIQMLHFAGVGFQVLGTRASPG